MPSLGIKYTTLTEKLAVKHGLYPTFIEGALVTEVKSGEVAEKLGIKFGDLILEVNGQRVLTAKEFHGQLNKAELIELALKIRRRKLDRIVRY